MSHIYNEFRPFTPNVHLGNAKNKALFLSYPPQLIPATYNVDLITYRPDGRTGATRITLRESETLCLPIRVWGISMASTLLTNPDIGMTGAILY